MDGAKDSEDGSPDKETEGKSCIQSDERSVDANDMTDVGSSPLVPPAEPSTEPSSSNAETAKIEKTRDMTIKQKVAEITRKETKKKTKDGVTDGAKEREAKESKARVTPVSSPLRSVRGAGGERGRDAEDENTSTSTSTSTSTISSATSEDNDEDDDDEDNLLNHDPTPGNLYPFPKWFSVRQLHEREYGRNTKPADPRLNRFSPKFGSFNSYWFKHYAYHSLYFIQRLELMEKLEEHNGCVNCLNFNPSGDLLCSGSDDLQIAIWDWQRSRLKHKYHSGHTSNVFQCRWCLDGNHIVSCARDGQVRISDVRNTVATSKKLAQHKASAHKLTLTSPQVVLSCGEDAVVYEMDLRMDKPTKLLQVKERETERRVPLYSIHCNMAFNPTQFAVCGRSPHVQVYDRRFLPSAESADPVMTFCPENLTQSKHSVTCAQYNSTATKMLASYNDEDVYTFDCKTGQKEHVYRGHRNSATVKGCSWFGDDFVLSGSDDGYVYGWHRESEHIVMSLYADENGVVNCIEPHPTAPTIATSGLDDNVKIWVPSANQWPQTLKGIKQRICTNIRDRKIEQKRASDHGEDFDAVDASMIWLIIRQLRQRNRANDDEDVEDDDNSDHEDVQQCTPS